MGGSPPDGLTIRPIESRGHMLPTPEECRAHYLDADRTQWRFALILFAVPPAFFVWFDYALFGLSDKFYVFVALRAVLLVYCAWLWTYLPRVTVPARAA